MEVKSLLRTKTECNISCTEKKFSKHLKLFVGLDKCNPNKVDWTYYNELCCTSSDPCGEQEGGCSTNDQCGGALVCSSSSQSCGSEFDTGAGEKCCHFQG